jgi:hypothetical protein
MTVSNGPLRSSHDTGRDTTTSQPTWIQESLPGSDLNRSGYLALMDRTSRESCRMIETPMAP